MQTVIQNLIQTLSKVGRTTIDFTNEDDVAFFTPLMNEALIQEVTKNDKKVKKAKKAAVVDKVKKDLNSYMIYCEWARKNAEFPDKQPKAISRRLGEMWRALSDEEKAGYKQQAVANKRPVEARADSPQRAESPSTDSVKPKKPLSPYIKFSNAMRDSVKANVSNPQDVSRRLGELWRGLTEEEKAKWKADDVSAQPVQVEPVFEKKDEPVEEKRDESPKKSKKTKKVKEDAEAGSEVVESPRKKEKKEKKEKKNSSE